MKVELTRKRPHSVDSAAASEKCSSFVFSVSEVMRRLSVSVTVRPTSER